MARLPKFVIPDQPQHVILRGNNRAEFSAPRLIIVSILKS